MEDTVGHWGILGDNGRTMGGKWADNGRTLGDTGGQWVIMRGHWEQYEDNTGSVWKEILEKFNEVMETEENHGDTGGHWGTLGDIRGH
ncbi:hypothetical protein ACOMHN_000125 [Nucella lapillus]